MKEALHQNKLASRMREHAGSRPRSDASGYEKKNPSLTLRVMKEALHQNKLASRMREHAGSRPRSDASGHEGEESVADASGYERSAASKQTGEPHA